MIKRELLDIVSSLNFWSKDQETGIDREQYTLKLEQYSSPKGITVTITGPRRAGKTTIAKQFLSKSINNGMAKEDTLYVNFEDIQLEQYINAGLLDSLYETYRHFLNKDRPAVFVLDEVQAVPSWEKWVRIMLERNENVKLIITGSSSRLLGKELATLLTGRTLPLKVFPLDFGEFLHFSGFSLKRPDGIGQKKQIMDLLHTYIEYGGFPLAVLTPSTDVKSALLKEIFEGIIMKDIAQRYDIRSTDDLRLLSVLALQNFAGLISVKKLSDIMQNTSKRKISPTTVNSFLHYFSEAFLFFYIPIFSYKIKDQMLYPKKLYCIDTGIINAVSSRFMENSGRLAENLVAIELVKRHGSDNIFYWKDTQAREVDFVIKDGLKLRELIQVCWNIDQPETKNREIRSLIAAMDEFGLKTGSILTEDFEGDEKIDGKTIVYKPLWKWLI